ncbi:MAG: hypothetical protein Q7U39_16505 [Nitrospira sp.]|nr:hypothetical protein [Nitrospira sp.]
MEKRTENIQLTPEQAIDAMRHSAIDMRSMSEVLQRSGVKFPNADIALYLWQREADRVGSIAATMESLLTDAIRQGRHKWWRARLEDEKRASQARYRLRNGSIDAIGSVLPDDQN